MSPTYVEEILQSKRKGGAVPALACQRGPWNRTHRRICMDEPELSRAGR
jgi:hypothetical protein